VKRLAILLGLISGFAFADGGMSTCSTDDYTTDTVTTTVWKAKVTRVRRNLVVVTSGTYHPATDYTPEAHPISDFGELTLTADPLSATQVWTNLHLRGGGFYQYLYSH
jgi:hypothetical protein